MGIILLRSDIMKRVYIIYYSETGNTEIMAKAIAEGVTEGGGKAKLLNGQDTTLEDILDADVLALGSPAMASEQLQVTMEVLTETIKDSITGKPVALFGSYDWGDGTWIRRWHKLMKGYGAEMIQSEEELIAHLKPDEEAIERCRELGKKLAK